jgi:ribosomal protein S18 acetylase RimI-like enzyme
MLVVRPEYRGRGIGRGLTEECVRRARRDGAPLIALHTTPIMAVALPMYERMGFEFLRAAPDRSGVPYGIYVKHLAPPENRTAPR